MTGTQLQPFYPEFVPNQVLTNTQLNQLRTYLDEQTRVSRIRLVGTGVVCGLTWTVSDTEDLVTVRAGYGVTSEGYMIGLDEATEFAHVRPYTDPGDDVYEPLQDDDAIWELLTESTTESETLTSTHLAGRVLVLYLEEEDVDLKSCFVTDCNNNGLNVQLNARLLLVDIDALEPIDTSCPQRPSLIVVPRFIAGLQKAFSIGLDEVEQTEHVNDSYGQIVSDYGGLLSDAWTDAFQYQVFLDLDDAELETIEKLPVLLPSGGAFNQYHYDFVKELACAYNEFVTLVCTLIPECCPIHTYPDPLYFPRHLMLGALDGDVGYRHHFMPSPVRNVMHADLERARKLFMRATAMIEAFEDLGVDAAEAGIKITPSHTELYALGERAVPYYYGFESDIAACWQPDTCCTGAPPWSYHTELEIEDLGQEIADLGYGKEALRYDYGKFSFMRIEGHLAMDCDTAKVQIKSLRTTENLEFDLLCLHLAAAAGPGGEASLPAAVLKKLKEIDDFLLTPPRLRQILDLIEPAPLPDNPVDQFRETLEKHKLELYTQNEYTDWIDARCAMAVRCDVSHLQADYLVLRSEMLSYYKRLFEYLSVLESFIDSIDDFFLDTVPKFTASRGRTAMLDLKTRADEATAKEVTLAEALKTATDDAEREKINQEFSKTREEQGFLRNLDNLMVKSIDVLTLKRTGVLLAAPVGEDGDAPPMTDVDFFLRLLYGLHLEFAALRDLIHDLIHYQLPKDLKCFNFLLFRRRQQDLEQALLEMKLLPIFLLWYAAASSVRDDLPLPEFEETESEGEIKIEGGSDSFLEQLVNLVENWEEITIDQEIGDLFTLGLHILGALPPLVKLFCDVDHVHELQTGFGALYYALEAHHEESRFATFAARHDGLEHLAGVEKGGTFILVCDQDPADGPSTVIADFSLSGQVGCCCDFDPDALCLPPVGATDFHFVVRPEPTDEEENPAAEADIDVLWNDFGLNDAATKPYANAYDANLRIELPETDTPQGGTVKVVDAELGTVRYTHDNPDFFGLDSFRYVVVDKTCDAGDPTQRSPGRVVVVVGPAFTPEQDQDEETFAVTVTVVDVETELVVPGAAVLLDGVLDVFATTDGGGQFIFTNISAGAHSFQATLGDRVSAIVDQDIGLGLPNDVSLELLPAEEETFTVTVTVVDAETGAGVPGATVLLDGVANAIATTDDQGQLSFADVSAGSHSFEASLGDRVSEAVLQEIGPKQTNRVTLVLPVVEEPEPAATLNGTVISIETREPLSDASVSLLDPSGLLVKGPVGVDNNGAYAFTDVVPGTYLVEARADAHQTAIEPVSLNAGDTTSVDFVLSTVEGVVIDIPDIFGVDFIDNMAEVRGISEDEARAEATTLFNERQDARLNVFATAKEQDSGIAKLTTFKNAQSFVETTIPDASVKGDDLDAAHKAVSGLVKRTIGQTTEARKPLFAEILTAVSQAYLDRLMFDNPTEVSPENAERINLVADNLRNAEVDMNAFRAGWDAATLRDGFGILAADDAADMFRIAP